MFSWKIANIFFFTFQTEFSSMFSERSPPPTSKDFLEKLEQKVVRDESTYLIIYFVLNFIFYYCLDLILLYVEKLLFF